MSNQTVTPSIATLTASGVALAMALTIASPQPAINLLGIAPTVTSVSPVASRGGLPASWSGLGANGPGAAVGPVLWGQVRLQVTGTLGGAAVVIQGSLDGGVTWFDITGVNDLTQRGFKSLQSDGLHIRTPEPGALGYGENPNPTAPPLPGGLIMLAVTNPQARFSYLRPMIYGGTGATAVNIAGNVSTVGAV